MPSAADLAVPAGDECRQVLLAAADGPTGRALLLALQQGGFEALWVKCLDELKRFGPGGFVPSVVFVELELTGYFDQSGLEVLRESFPSAAIVALGTSLDGERAAQLLGLGVASLGLPVSSEALAAVVRRLAGNPRSTLPPTPSGVMPALRTSGQLDAFVSAYSTARGLSERQKAILAAYLTGSNDKQIAGDSGCSEATVYEHWRRMARKAGGFHKSDVIADFHRFLGGE